MVIVTPFTGVWIEINSDVFEGYSFLSLPLRECGLKLSADEIKVCITEVTPFTGVWIEINNMYIELCGKNSHSLYGSVD